MSSVKRNEEQYGHVQLLLHFNSVEKTFQVPGRHIQELLDVYGLLHDLKPPGAIQCASLEVSIRLNKSACKILHNVWCHMSCQRSTLYDLSYFWAHWPGLHDTQNDIANM